MIRHPSPNFGDRPHGIQPSLFVVHYTGMTSADAALRRLCDPSAQVSAHYLIDEIGATVEMVDPQKRAWHAGVSHWDGSNNVNDISIGIELVNPGHDHGYTAFPRAQMAALQEVMQSCAARFSIPAYAVVGHSDVAPARKLDPGEKFDWRFLAAAGFGLVTRTDTTGRDVIAIPGLSGGAVALAQKHLLHIGYKQTLSGVYDQETLCNITAFQRHWRQRSVNGLLDTGTVEALDDIVRQLAQRKA